MDFGAGKSALLEAMALLHDESNLTMKITALLNKTNDDKSRVLSSFCEILVLQNQEAEKKKKVANLLDEVSKWWGLLVEDREKLLMTISNLELEKEAILKKHDDPNEIYKDMMDMEASSHKKKPRMSISRFISSKGYATSANTTTSSIDIDTRSESMNADSTCQNTEVENVD